MHNNSETHSTKSKEYGRGGGSHYNNPPVLSIVIPCYNEEEVVAITHETLQRKLLQLAENNLISRSSYLLFIDDGSCDNTYQILKDLAFSNNTFKTKVIKLSKNFGHQNALLAGLMEVKNHCDCCITIDSDLQQDIEKFDEFLYKFSHKFDIVLGVRKDRKTDGFLKKWSALIFYKIMNFMGVETIKNHADYRLISNRGLQYLSLFKEYNLFLRGLIFELGLKKDIVYFDVKERKIGASKYTLLKMLSLACNGITSFSIIPLRIISVLGFIIFLVSFVLGLYSLIIATIFKTAIPGWASTVIPIYILGGIQILSLGIIGEYIGKIYKESKARPTYLIEEKI